MERQQYSLKVGFWNVNGLSEEQASDDLLQNEIREYDILFLGETWQYKDKRDNLDHPLGYSVNLFTRRSLTKKGVHPGIYLFITVVSCNEKSSENIIWIKIDKAQMIIKITFS